MPSSALAGTCVVVGTFVEAVGRFSVIAWRARPAVLAAQGHNPTGASRQISLRLGHLAALTCHRHVIHYREAASLPFSQGSLSAAYDLRASLCKGSCQPQAEGRIVFAPTARISICADRHTTLLTSSLLPITFPQVTAQAVNDRPYGEERPGCFCAACTKFQRDMTKMER